MTIRNNWANHLFLRRNQHSRRMYRGGGHETGAARRVGVSPTVQRPRSPTSMLHSPWDIDTIPKLYMYVYIELRMSSTWQMMRIARDKTVQTFMDCVCKNWRNRCLVRSVGTYGADRGDRIRRAPRPSTSWKARGAAVPRAPTDRLFTRSFPRRRRHRRRRRRQPRGPPARSPPADSDPGDTNRFNVCAAFLYLYFTFTFY